MSLELLFLYCVVVCIMAGMNPPTTVLASTATMATTTRSDHPIAAVTGASGFIGSHLVQNLLEHGYVVRACVRNHVPSKVDHLLALADSPRVQQAGGVLEIWVADMSQRGAYDAIFGNGCEYIFHVAGNFGTDYHLWKSKTAADDDHHEKYQKGRPSPMDALRKELATEQQRQRLEGSDAVDTTEEDSEKYYSYDHAVYESYVVAMEWLLESVAKHKDTIRRVVYTSSGAAGETVTGPPVPKDEHILDDSYGWAKHDCEAMLYDFCQKINEENRSDGTTNTIVGVSVCPCIVMGPMMGAPPLHDSVYPHRLSDMLRGRYTLRQHWEITDVRDVAETHRLAAETPGLVNGSRFWNGNPSWWISAMLRYLVGHEAFRDDPRLSPILLQDDSDGGSSSSGSSSSSSESGNGSHKDNNDDDGDKSDDESEGGSSSSSDDSYGISEWDGPEHRTKWSDPMVVFENANYHPKTPKETVMATTAAIVERWEGLGRDLTIQECMDYYTVAEMDGCHLEMKWLAEEIRTKLEATSGTGSEST